MTLSDRVKDAFSLRDLAEARGVVFDSRKSQPSRGDWWAPCPFHGERTPSFHVVEPATTGGFFKCFGCGVKGSVVDFIMELDGLDAGGALKALAQGAGLESDPDPVAEARRIEERTRRLTEAEARAEQQAESRWRGAVQVWKRAHRAPGLITPYLAARGVDLDAIGGVPPVLRFAPKLNFWAQGQNRRKETAAHSGPAMVAAIGCDGRLVGVHRTWITANDRARFPDGRKVDKKWLGRTGAMFGQPVRFCRPGTAMVVGEGIETTLAAWSILRRMGEDVSAEAALSRGALADGSWSPPTGVARVILLAEGSSRTPRNPGEASGAEEAEAATRSAVQHLERRGIQVRVALPGGRWDQDIDAADIAKEFRA